MPRIHRDSAELDSIEQGVQIAANDPEVGSPTLSLDSFDPHAFRRLSGILLEECLSIDTVWKPLEDERTVLHHGEHQRGDRRVVTHQVTLCEFLSGEKHFREIGNTEFQLPGDLDRPAPGTVFDFL